MRTHFAPAAILALLLCLLLPGRILAQAATVVGNGTPASCTAAALATAIDAGGTITFDCGLEPVTIAGGPYTVAGALTIDGGGLVTLSGEDAHRHFVVTTEGSLRLANLTLTGGSAVEGGGSIFSEGVLVLDTVVVHDNRTTGVNSGGGAVVSLGGALTIFGSHFYANVAAYTAGAILQSNGVLVIENSVIDGNSAAVFGAIDSTGDLTIRNTMLRGNRATAGDGGAVGVIDGTARIEDSLIEGNFAGSGGGGVYSSPNFPGTTVTIRDTRIIRNEADTTFAGALGGGILSGAGLTLERVTLAENSAYNAGGLFQYGDEGLLIVRDSLVHNNSAVQSGGGLMLSGALGHTFTNVTISGNSAGDWAGGLYVPDHPATLRHVTIYGNSAPLGANLYTLRTTVTFASTILDNPQGGGENCAVQDTAQPAISDGYNVSSDESCSLNHAGDLSATDPLLGPLADNGGPTLSHLPQPGSPAIDRAPLAGCPAADQRGFTRPGGAACDSGAVEVGGQLITVEPVAPVDNASHVTTGNGAYYWVSPRQCNVIPPRPETIARRDVQGVTPARLLYQNPDGCSGDARLVRSNVVADRNYLFYTTDQGLMRLALTAQVGAADTVQLAAVDNAELINTDLKGVSQIALNASNVVGLDAARRIWRVAKTGGAGQVLQNLGAISNVKSATAFGVNYIYWQNGVDLIRYNTSTGASTTIATGVVTYLPLGERRSCQPGLLRPNCTSLDAVLISRGNRVDEYNALSNQVNTLYTSNKWIYELAYTESGYLLALEEESNGICLPGIFNTCLYTDFISRIPLRYGDRYLFVPALPTAFIYNGAPNYQRTLRQLGGEGDYVLWVERGQVRRLPLNTTSLPNVRVTGIEVTQGIQNINNTVTLIKNRRTFVRVYVQSTHGAPLRGISATLTGYSGAQLGVLQPAIQGFACSGAPGLGGNLNCTYDRTITAQVSPDRRQLAQSFLFELPLSWTNRDTPLRLVAQINPDRAPVESNFDDNRLTRDFTFRPSGRFEVLFVQWGYQLSTNGPWIYPTAKDNDHIQSYIRRTYPVATTTSTWEGFHPSTWRIADANMGRAVNRNKEFCDGLGLPADRHTVCAATYSNQQMERRRYTWWNLAGLGIKAGQVIPDNIFMYGVISDTTTSTTEIRFPRGSTPYNGNEASGPTGSSSTKWSWDPDGIYGDWYAAHEIGHALGLRHPATGNTTSDGCTTYTQSDVDPRPSHQFSRIGADNDTLGFDVGDNRLGIGQRTYAPQNMWHDFMSYCSNQWISDQNYERLYHEIMDFGAVRASAPRTTVFTGDWWLVQGGLHTDGSGGAISHAERLNVVSTLGERTAGAYAIQLLRSDGAVLAAYPFTPQGGLHDAPTLQFTELVTNVQGTTILRIVRVADGVELARRSISPHPPVVSNVMLPATVSATATSLSLTWSASDADGDALTYDVYYSLDGGATLLPLQLSLAQPSATVSIEALPGGTAIFRVVATDGANTAFADSAPFVMPQRAPAVRIDSPADGATIRFGQSLNFIGYALDPQDGPLGGDSLTWRIGDEIVATGEVYEAMSLPVGTHQITLTAVNSARLATSFSIAMTVVDDLTLPEAQVAATPSDFNFTFNLEGSSVQTATMSIADIGEALEPLSWTVTISGAAWLTVDMAAGVTPAQIVLTASAAGLPSGSVERGSIELSAATPEGSLVQRIAIPVTRSAATTPFVGEDVQPSDPRIFLPVIYR
jgi:hypothetical protein